MIMRSSSLSMYGILILCIQRKNGREEWIYLKKNKSHKFETLHKTKDGKLITVEIQANYLSYDDTEYSCAFSRDITERKRIEEYLKITQLAMDKFGDSIIWLSSDGRLVYVNEAACKSLGYSKKELLSMYIWDIDPNFPPERYLKDWREEYRQRGFLKFETLHVARDGRTFTVDVTASYIKYGDKEFLITFDKDISERKQAEETLRESEEKFRVLAETSSAAIIVFQDKWPVSVNKATETITGYTKDELFKMHYWEIIHPEFREFVRERSLAKDSEASRCLRDMRQRSSQRAEKNNGSSLMPGVSYTRESRPEWRRFSISQIVSKRRKS